MAKKPIQVLIEEDVLKKFKDVCDGEARKYGPQIEILIREWLEKKEKSGK